MTFWQENKGFVKDVYNDRYTMYETWMNKLDAICAKVMAEGVQYTFVEFSKLQVDLRSLTRDLEKEGMKSWLDMMLEKVATPSGGEGETISAKDKELKAAERKKLQTLIDRHDTLMPSTKETQAKVEVYARCYAYGDDIKPTVKTLDEMLHLSIKEIHPHNMSMVEEQIDKSEKVINTIEAQRDTYDDLLKRGQKLIKLPNHAPFLGDLLSKMENTWKDANEKSQERIKLLKTTAVEWEKYDDLRAAVNDPVEKLEGEFKRYRKFFDPDMGTKKFQQKKALWEDKKKACEEMHETIKACFDKIVVVAGDEKKDYLEKEVAEVVEKMTIIKKCEERLTKLVEYNDKLAATVAHARELDGWAKPTKEKIDHLAQSSELAPDVRLKDVMAIYEEMEQRKPQLEPLNEEYRELLTEEDLEKSETAKKTLQEWEDIMNFTNDLCNQIESESEIIKKDHQAYSDYLNVVNDFEPWIVEAETHCKNPLTKPQNFEEAQSLLNGCKDFFALCETKKENLDNAAKARESMEKATTAENLVEVLGGRWEAVKKISDDRVKTMTNVEQTWNDLQKTTLDLAQKMGEVPKQAKPDLEEIDKVFTAMKWLNDHKKELLAAI